jgi:WD40 repeat protein
VHGNPPKPRASFDIISNHTTSHKPKVSASLPSSEFILNRSSIVDQRINMVNWREPKRIEDPSPVASRRAALGKLYIKERSHTLPVDIIAWSPKSSGSLAAGKRAAAVAAGHSALMVTGNAIAPASAPANRNVRTERPF